MLILVISNQMLQWFSNNPDNLSHLEPHEAFISSRKVSCRKVKRVLVQEHVALTLISAGTDEAVHISWRRRKSHQSRKTHNQVSLTQSFRI